MISHPSSYPDSLFRHWDPRCKLAGLLVLIAAFSFVQDMRLLPFMAAVTGLAVIISGLGPSFVLRRLRWPALFIIVLVLILPFASGETTLISLGFLTIYREGLQASLLVTVRFVCIVTMVIVLLGTAPLQSTLQAMGALKVPALMIDMAMLFLRYLSVVGDDFRRMERAMKLRGFRGAGYRFNTLRTLAWLTGSLFITSYERSDRVYRAMLLRGYGRRPVREGAFAAKPRDGVILGLCIFLAILLVAFEMELSS